MAQNTEDVTPDERAKYAQQASTDHFMVICGGLHVLIIADMLKELRE